MKVAFLLQRQIVFHHIFEAFSANSVCLWDYSSTCSSSLRLMLCRYSETRPYHWTVPWHTFGREFNCKTVRQTPQEQGPGTR